MRIGILNLFYSNKNYGAVLQAYALQAFLTESGVDAWVINFKPKTCRSSLITHLFEIVRNNPFAKFRKAWLKPITRPFFTLEELYDADFKAFRGFIVGSDQVWRPKYNFEPLAYFLPFVKKNACKIAYAASFGVGSWEKDNSEELTYEIQRLISDFDFISVREDSGVRICKDKFNVDAEQTLDPTLLVGRKLFEKVIGSKHSLGAKIVYYKLDDDEDFHQSLGLISEKLGLGIKNIHAQKKSILWRKYLQYPDVRDWLVSIRDSALVMTDSYHCLCFALLFQKQFIYFSNHERGMSRVESLLGRLDLEQRIYNSLQELKGRNDWETVIDYNYVDRILQEERIKSKQFLTNAIHRCNQVVL